MFLYSTGLACSYCLHDNSLCFFIRDQTLVSSIITLTWTFKEIEEVLGLVNTVR